MRFGHPFARAARRALPVPALLSVAALSAGALLLAGLSRDAFADEIRSYDDLLNPKWKGRIGLLDQWNESPQAHDPPAFGLSMVNPCFSMESTKSITAPCR